MERTWIGHRELSLPWRARSACGDACAMGDFRKMRLLAFQCARDLARSASLAYFLPMLVLTFKLLLATGFGLIILALL